MRAGGSGCSGTNSNVIVREAGNQMDNGRSQDRIVDALRESSVLRDHRVATGRTCGTFRIHRG